MAGIPPFRAKRVGMLDSPRALWAAIEQLEHWASMVPGIPGVEVDESGPRPVVYLPDGQIATVGGGGDSAPEPVTSHKLLDDLHEDTVDGDPAEGDIIIANATPAWTRLPKGSDGQVLTLDSGLPAWGSVGSVISGSILGAWAINSIDNLGTTGDGSEMFAAWSKGANDTMSVVMPVAGQVTALSVYLDGDVGAAGASATFSLYQNGSNSGLTVAVTGSTGTEQKGYPGTGGPVSFAAGDELTIYGLKAGTVGSRKAVVYVWGVLGV